MTASIAGDLADRIADLDACSAATADGCMNSANKCMSSQIDRGARAVSSQRLGIEDGNGAGLSDQVLSRYRLDLCWRDAG
jgi:hypothetical protein